MNDIHVYFIQTYENKFKKTIIAKSWLILNFFLISTKH
jgi:hypothetical protein